MTRLNADCNSSSATRPDCRRRSSTALTVACKATGNRRSNSVDLAALRRRACSIARAVCTTANVSRSKPSRGNCSIRSCSSRWAVRAFKICRGWPPADDRDIEQRFLLQLAAAVSAAPHGRLIRRPDQVPFQLDCGRSPAVSLFVRDVCQRPKSADRSVGCDGGGDRYFGYMFFQRAPTVVFHRPLEAGRRLGDF